MNQCRTRVVVVLAAGAALGLAAAAVSLGPLRAAAATFSFTVTTTSDASVVANPTCTAPCSLRQAVNAASVLGTGNTVTIDFSVAGPFVLTQGQLDVSNGVTLTIQGSSDGSTVINGNATSREIRVTGGAASTHLTLNHVRLTNGAPVATEGDDGFGGGIDVNTGGAATIIDSTIDSNTASAGGGGVDNNSTSSLLIIRSNISGNTASLGGGGIDANTVANATVIDSTISGNTAGADGGGGIVGFTGGSVTLVNDTITGNSATGTAVGGVLAVTTGTTAAANTIISGNSTTNCGGTVTDQGNNLENGGSCGFATNAVHADPLLGPLHDNGGDTSTMALDPGSPAIGAGSNTVCARSTAGSPAGAGAEDQRGATRPQASTCDIGAFEVVATTTTVSSPATSTQGDSVTFMATVTPAQKIPSILTGTVAFFDGATMLGTAPVSGDPMASFSTSALSAGSHTITAQFQQTPQFLPSSSAGAAIAVAAPVPPAGSGIPWAPAGALLICGIATLVLLELRTRE